MGPKYPDYPHVPKGSRSSMIHPSICYFRINQLPLFTLVGIPF